MPGGKQHYKIHSRNLKNAAVLSIFLTILGISLGGLWAFLGIFSFIGYFLGRYIDPDLDQASTNSSEWRAMRELKIFGVMLVMLFLPYGYLFKHRSAITHSLIFSTVIRFMWLFLPLLLLLYWTSGSIHVIINVYVLFIGTFIGLAYADSLHILADKGLIQ